MLHKIIVNYLRKYGVSVFILFLCLGLSVNAKATEKLSNKDILDAVENELVFDPIIYTSQVDIQCEDGVITLSGKVDNLLAKERAKQIAETVKGVSAVVNNITVSPPALRNDSEIKKDIETALLEDPATNESKVTVTVEDRVAMLEGEVDSLQEKQLCENITKAVRGVINVNNNIKVIPKKMRPDFEIYSEIESALSWNTLLDDKLIKIHVDNGLVKLSGVVGSASEKNKAIAMSYTAGVQSVDASELKVERWARDEDLRKGKYGNKEDEDIRKAIENALLFDHRVNALDINLEVENGVVSLRGFTENMRAKRTAVQIARNTVGVIMVRDRIKVKPKVLSKDEEIAEKIQEALNRNPYTHHYKITSKVRNGIASLYGDVDNVFEKNQADDIVARVDGVADIKNYIKVADVSRPYYFEPHVDPFFGYDYLWNASPLVYPRKNDSQIKNDIMHEFFWSPFLDEKKIDISVKDGMVTLTGSVDSLMEYDAATENAYEGGARQVNNELKVAR